MGINMSYCMFENTVKAMEEIKERMWDEDFDPDNLSNYERRAYDALYDLVDSIKDALDEIEERKEMEEAEREFQEECDDQYSEEYGNDDDE